MFSSPWPSPTYFVSHSIDTGSLPNPMAQAKSLVRLDDLEHDIRQRISSLAQDEFTDWIEEAYYQELHKDVKRHIFGGWPIRQCCTVYLHWLCQYPTFDWYQTNNGLPKADASPIFRRVQHLCNGWADQHLQWNLIEERLSLDLDLPPDQSEFANCTLFADGVEYARTKKGLNDSKLVKMWYGIKTRGPAWRVVVHSTSIFTHSSQHFGAHPDPLASNHFLFRQHVYDRIGMGLLSTEPVPAGSKRSGEREMLDDSDIFNVMDEEKDVLFLDKGYFGMEGRHPEYKFCIPPNKSENAYKKASKEKKMFMDDLDAKHKRLALGHVERWNREVRYFTIVAKTTKYRSDMNLFPTVLKHCLAFRNIRHSMTLKKDQ